MARHVLRTILWFRHHDHRRRATQPPLLRDGDQPGLLRRRGQALGKPDRQEGGEGEMTRGRKPKPTKLKLLYGNQGKRALNADEG